MAKEDIKKLVEESKKQLAQEHETFERSIKDDLKSFKKKTLDKI
jgi:hypothetical protein